MVIAVRVSLQAIALLSVSLSIASAQGVRVGSDVLSACPTLARLVRTGEIDQLERPVFTDREAARRFAAECKTVAAELDRAPFTADCGELRRQAVLAAEFLTGDTYLFATSDVRSVVKLRDLVKIPPPSGFVFVRKYASKKAMPREVAGVFQDLGRSETSEVRGVTIRGRYIALLQTEYHDELVDNLSHELVHAYLALASQTDLPRWFQEGAAVYFSTGKESGLYFKTGDPRIKEVTIPEDYKRKLYSFQYIERRLGQQKLFEFVRRSVETGRVDPPLAIGPAPSKGPGRRPVWAVVLVGAGIAGALLIAWVLFRRDEGWVD